MTCDGSAELTTGVYLGQQNRTPFGIVYMTKVGDDTHPSMDSGSKLHIIYNCTASPSGRGYTTINENPDAITMSWEATSTPVDMDGRKPVSSIVIDEKKAGATNWKKITEKVYGTEGAGGSGGTSPTLIDPNAVAALLGVSLNG